MKALVQTKNGGPEVLQVQELPDPQVGPGEVRIAVKAAGVNFADTMARLIGSDNSVPAEVFCLTGFCRSRGQPLTSSFSGI